MFIFYHEFNSLSSGAAVLITNLVKGLLNSGKEVLLINYQNGVIHKELESGKSVGLTVINKDIESIKRISSRISTKDIIITTHFYTVYKYFLNANPRILFFCINTTSLNEVNRFPFGINFRGITRKLISILENKSGIVFGDEYAFEQNSAQFDLNKGHQIIPIPVVVPGNNQYLSKRHPDRKNETVITYVGRAINWKMFPAKKILLDLIAENITDVQICFKIVTDNAQVFRKAMPLDLPQNIRLDLYENLTQAELEEFLIKNADLHFAMGTAALDGARLGIPTILLDLAYREFPENYRYNFVYDTSPSFIGTDANLKGEHRGATMKELIELTKNKPELEGVSMRSYEYIKKYHNISGITPLIEKSCDECKMTLNDARAGILKFWL